MCVDTHVSRSSRERLSLPVGDVLLRLGVAVLLRHTEINDVNDISSLGPRPSYQKVVGLNVSVDEILLMDGLYSRELSILLATRGFHLHNCDGTLMRFGGLTICLATMTTVLIENLRLQWSKRSSNEGPSRSMTRML